MPSSSASAPYTWDDFVALEEDDLRELIDGELVEVDVPTWSHEVITGWLVFYLRAWAEAAHGGSVVASGYKCGSRTGEASCPTSSFIEQATRRGASADSCALVNNASSALGFRFRRREA